MKLQVDLQGCCRLQGVPHARTSTAHGAHGLSLLICFDGANHCASFAKPARRCREATPSRLSELLVPGHPDVADGAARCSSPEGEGATLRRAPPSSQQAGEARSIGFSVIEKSKDGDTKWTLASVWTPRSRGNSKRHQIAMHESNELVKNPHLWGSSHSHRPAAMRANGATAEAHARKAKARAAGS